ncbi:protein of unknown function (plasmid) [Azospirillum baldaniorum]|uniref:Uncharacterized protein n=1 Tax=Azospirillum baldaniorum TaxID=1064539 RepID=A0A9P1JVP7_9PROT|nr:protein of unknown function [Azospirillum baldaniorum]
MLSSAALRRLGVDVGVEAVLGDAEPQPLLVAEGLPRLVDLLEARVLRRQLVVQLVGDFLAGHHDVAREGAELGSAGHQTLQRRGVDGVVLGDHPGVGLPAGLLQDRLVGLRKLLPRGDVDHQRDLGGAFPPAWRVVVFGDLVEAQLLVVVGADELRRVDGAALQRRVDVAAADLLRDEAQLAHDLPGQPADPHLEAAEVLHRLDFLAEPAAHLGRRVAGGDVVDIVLPEQLAHQLQPAAVHHPGDVLARVQAEGHGRVEAEGRVLADVEVGRGLAALDRAVLHRVQHLERRHDLARREGADLELVVGGGGDPARDQLRPAEDGVEALGVARRHAPLDLGLALRDGWCGDDGAGGQTDTGAGEEGTTFHGGGISLPIHYVYAAGLSGKHRGGPVVSAAELGFALGIAGMVFAVHHPPVAQ